MLPHLTVICQPAVTVAVYRIVDSAFPVPRYRIDSVDSPLPCDLLFIVTHVPGVGYGCYTPFPLHVTLVPHPIWVLIFPLI